MDGSSKMVDELMESIEPFDFSEAVPFQTAYLAGYMADKYDVDAEESVERANERVKRATEEAFAAKDKMVFDRTCGFFMVPGGLWGWKNSRWGSE